MTAYATLTDAELFDMSMYRCECGEAVYPDGNPAPHCEASAAREKAAADTNA